jgi:putative intracellular protease/amidase
MTKNRKCALFLFDTYADWEPALAVAGLNEYSDFSIETFSITGGAIVSNGGLEVHTKYALEHIHAEDYDLLLLPGGSTWEQGGNREIESLVRSFVEQKKTIAAICAATTLLGDMGLLDNISHTSNALDYLQHYAPAYKGEAHYSIQPAVSAENIITANGAAMIEFAFEIFKAFDVMDETTFDALFDLYKSGGMVNRLYP